jgi:hypothetical protein
VPYVTRPKHLRSMISALAGLVALLGVPGVAQAACPATPTIKAFQAFNDAADYSLVSNGAFEAGTGGWSLSGASVVSGNESYKVHGAADSKSLAIAPTARVVSPAFCVSIDHPTFRFFARRTSGTWGSMNVGLRWKDSTGKTNETVVGAIGNGTSWSPTQPLNLSGPIGLWSADQTASVQIVFDPEDFGGSWAIDDVYIDPYRR